MDKKRYRIFSRFGKLLGALLIIGMVWTCSAVLNPAFDLKNQNGMPSYYYTCGDTVYITDKTTSPDGDSILAYNWTVYPSDIGKTENGIICESNLPAEDFNFTVPCPLSSYPANFTIQLDMIGQKSWPTKYTAKVNFTVDDYSEYIRANFSYSVDYENTIPNVTFFDLSEAQNLALINEWYWTLNGEQMGDEKSPVVSVQLEAGTYLVNLSVRDKAGDIASISKEVVISEKRGSQSSGDLIADFNAVTTAGIAPFTVQFMDLSTGGPTAWSWDFGDGSTSSEKSPTHTYLRTGYYDVNLKVFNQTLGENSIMKENFITAASSSVKALFRYGYPESGNTKKVQFTDVSTGVGINSWEWNFGDGLGSTEQNPVHEYVDHGCYVISLKVTNVASLYDIRSYKVCI